MSKERIYTALALSFAFLQTLLPTMHLADEGATIATTVLVTLVSIFTILKQRISVEINRNAQVATWILIAVAAFGGINQLIDVINFDELWQERLRTIIAALIGILNILSKNLFPTDEARGIEAQKRRLEQMQKFK